MLHISTLKNVSSYFLIAKPFEGRDNVGQHFIGSGRRPRRHVLLVGIFVWIYENNGMNMIGHYYITVYFYTGDILAITMPFKILLTAFLNFKSETCFLYL